MPSGWTVYVAACAAGVIGGALAAVATDGPSTVGLIAAAVAAAVVLALIALALRRRRPQGVAPAATGEAARSDHVAHDTAVSAPASVEASASAPTEAQVVPAATADEPVVLDPVASEPGGIAAPAVEHVVPAATDRQDLGPETAHPEPASPAAYAAEPVTPETAVPVAPGVAGAGAASTAPYAPIDGADVALANGLGGPAAEPLAPEAVVADAPAAETPAAPAATDSRRIGEEDWDALAAVCAGISNPQLGWIRTDPFSRPWLDDRVRPFLNLEPRAIALRERPFSDALRTRLGAFADATSGFAAFYGDNTFPDPLLSASDWRFFDWNELTNAAPGASTDDLWGARAGKLQGLALAMADAYELLRDTAASDSKERDIVQAGTTARFV